MNETLLLTEKQIFRRKTVAIWLIGAGTLLPIFFMSLNMFYVPWSIFSNNLVTFYLFDLLLAGGLIAVIRLADRTGKIWIKHWIIVCIVYTPLDCLLRFISISIFADSMIVCSVLFALISFYRLWAVDVVRQHSGDPWIVRNVRLIQMPIVLLLLVAYIGNSGNIAFWMKSTGVLSGIAADDFHQLFFAGSWRLFCIIINLFCGCLLFVGMKRLIRSDLFASAASDLPAYVEQPAPATSVFTAPFCGALAASVFCCGLVWLLIAYLGEWNRILFEEIFW